MRPFRIVRRLVARATHWGSPHVHCPGCGADVSVPDDSEFRICFTCRTTWFRHELSGDQVVDFQAIEARVPTGSEFAVTWRPLVVDHADGLGGKETRLLDAALVYLV